MTLHSDHYFAKLIFNPFLMFLSAALLLLIGCSTSGGEESVPTSPAEEPTVIDTSVLATEEPEPLPTLTPPPIPASAEMGDANVLFVSAQMTAENVWLFSVTVEHDDTGWEDYADGWDVVLPDGTVLLPNSNDPFTRLLLHPHENEQPFTRSQSNIEIPVEITQVSVRAHDSVDGFGGQEVVVDLTAVSGENFEVDR